MGKELSTKFLTDLALGTHSMEKSLSYIKDNLILRDSGKELKILLENKNIDVKTLSAQFGEANIKRWLNGKAISREKAIELCFVLNLDIDEAELFLQKTCGHEWFHMRDYKDVIYYFFLLNKLPYQRTLPLIEKYAFLDSANPGEIQSPNKSSSTHMIKLDIVDYENEDELCEYLEKNAEKFGSFNNTAYNYFKLFFEKVSANEEEYRNWKIHRVKDNYFEDYDILEDDAEWTDGDIKKNAIKNPKASFKLICGLMRVGMPVNLKKDEFTSLQAMLYSNMPNISNLIDIYNRRVDKNGKIKQINRKSLIMIWILANEEKEFISRVMIINQILEECGFSKLDSKNPFDWIVLNSLEMNENGSDGIDRIREIMYDIFNINKYEED